MSSEGAITVHVRKLVDSFNVEQMVKMMKSVYARYNIRVKIGSNQFIKSQDLKNLEVEGGCSSHDNISTEQIQLFNFRNVGLAPNVIPIGADEIVAYFIESFSPTPLNGCSVHPKDRPGCAVAVMASKWTLAHEVAHVLGVPGHPTVDDPNRLMVAGTQKIRSNQPYLTEEELHFILSSPCIKRG